MTSIKKRKYFDSIRSFVTVFANKKSSLTGMPYNVDYRPKRPLITTFNKHHSNESIPTDHSNPPVSTKPKLSAITDPRE